MEKIPNDLECSYCIRSLDHGGQCGGKSFNSANGCLGFEEDEKGCIKNSNFNIGIKIFEEFPSLNEWSKGWTIKGQETELRINRIRGLKWDREKGQIIVRCNCDFFFNEFKDNFQEEKQAPKAILKIIK